MASPTSPPLSNPLVLPRQRPTLALPTGIKSQSRKPSLTSAPSSAHPLRQTSFPPPDRNGRAQYSPSAEGSLDDDLDDDIRSALSGPANDDTQPARKRRRIGEKGARCRKSKLKANGARAPSVLTADNDADAEADSDSDPDTAQNATGSGRAPLYEGGQLSAAEQAEELSRRHAFYELATDDQRERYNSWTRAKLRTADVRRLVNSTLSQSVPQNVVLVVSAYAKMFAGVLVEGAREVQGEWMASEERRADGGNNAASKRLKRTFDESDAMEAGNGTATAPKPAVNGSVKVEALTPISPANATPADPIQPLLTAGAGGLSPDIEECDRGPLLPEHLREALRRYKKRQAGSGAVGFTGLSLEGSQNTAAKMGGGGRRLFK
ncbi:hypothetical protein LTR53_001160 [Teratosphaeriaceae sp. CCFEE 6253]|nr:hypothetical protein LTR53_001160 [Teratosphaeriaceae sp. CCFEE 6253]